MSLNNLKSWIDYTFNHDRLINYLPSAQTLTNLSYRDTIYLLVPIPRSWTLDKIKRSTSPGRTSRCQSLGCNSECDVPTENLGGLLWRTQKIQWLKQNHLILHCLKSLHAFYTLGKLKIQRTIKKKSKRWSKTDSISLSLDTVTGL